MANSFPRCPRTGPAAGCSRCIHKNWGIRGISATCDFAVTHNCGSGLGAGGSCNLNITFRPAVAGTRIGSVVISSSAASSSNTIALRGTGIGPPSAPTLDSIAPGAGSATLIFTAPTNIGGTTIASYTGTCTASAQATRTATAFGSPLVVGGLTGDVAYLCSMTAINDAGLTGGPSTTPSVTSSSPEEVKILSGQCFC